MKSEGNLPPTQIYSQEVGLSDLPSQYTEDKCWVSLTQNTLCQYYLVQ